jgi:menaquinol-cytochrome c reductase iron-sulfur subunit
MTIENSPRGAQPPEPKTTPRRLFFRWLTGALGAVASAMAGIPLVGYFLGQRKRGVYWVAMGPVKDFPRNETRMITFDNPLRQPWDGMTAYTGVYVRYEGQDDAQQSDRFLVLAVNCAHLGCPVSWFPQSGLFMCPCHGGVYYSDGQRASDPPPRGMYRCVWRVRNGQLEIQSPHFPTLQDTLGGTA